MRKFCWNTQFSQGFEWFARNSMETVRFYKILTPGISWKFGVSLSGLFNQINSNCKCFKNIYAMCMYCTIIISSYGMKRVSFRFMLALAHYYFWDFHYTLYFVALLIKNLSSELILTNSWCFSFATIELLKGTVMQSEKALIKNRLRVSKSISHSNYL